MNSSGSVIEHIVAAPSLHFLRLLARDGATDIHPGGAAASARLVEALALAAGQVVLEIGCGPGLTLARVAAACESRAIGLDLMPEMLAVAARRLRWSGLGRRVELVRGDVASLPFRSGSCDRIYGESVIGIQDASRIRTILAELHRVLKPGGRCVLNDAIWRITASEAEIDAANRACMGAFGLRQASEAHWRLDDWILELNRAGFQVRVLPRARRPAGGRRDASLPLRVRIASVSLSMLQRLDTLLRPSELRRRRAYRELARRHGGLGRLVESRMFVLERPR